MMKIKFHFSRLHVGHFVLNAISIGEKYTVKFDESNNFLALPIPRTLNLNKNESHERIHT